MNQRIRFSFLLIGLMIVFSENSFAQEVIEDNDLTNQVWISFNPSYRINEKLDLVNEIGFKSISPNVWQRYHIRSDIKFNIPKFMLKTMKYRESLHAGLGLYFTDNKFESNRLEIRPFQGYLLDWPDWTRVRLRQFVRLEERFDLETENWTNTFGLRFRYLVDLTFKLQGDILPEAKGIYLAASMEFFWNLIGAKQFNDVYRTNAGIGANLSEKWRLEFRFGYNYSRNTTTEDFQTNDLVYQFKTYFNIP